MLDYTIIRPVIFLIGGACYLIVSYYYECSKKGYLDGSANVHEPLYNTSATRKKDSK